jgi:DNA-binding NtrC family response regulator
VTHARVLIVHDVSAIRQLVSHSLESQGCTAIGVEDCRSASALDRLDPPDVIVADERLIDADPDAFEAMRGAFPKAVVVALAAPMRMRASALHRGVDCTVEKPAGDDQLLKAIDWALELSAPDSPDLQV